MSKRDAILTTIAWVLITLAFAITAATVFGQSSIRGTLLVGPSIAGNQTGSLDDHGASLRLLADSEIRRGRWSVDNRFSVLFGPQVKRLNLTKTLFTNATVARYGTRWFGGPGIMFGAVRTSRGVQERNTTDVLAEFGRRIEGKDWDAQVFGTARLKTFGKDSHKERGGTVTFEASKPFGKCGASVRLIPGYLRFTNQSETLRRWQVSFDALVGVFCGTAK